MVHKTHRDFGTPSFAVVFATLLLLIMFINHSNVVI